MSCSCKGSGISTASARYPRARQASAPLPVHSSSTTLWTTISAAGCRPAADIVVQSVVEEECTGNGALACLARGYRADAVLIPEPLQEQLIRAQIGVIWFQVHVRGIPVHVAQAGAGANAIE